MYILDDYRKWINVWIYAFRNLKEEFAFEFMESVDNGYGSRYRYVEFCDIMGVIFFYAPHTVVRDIVTYIIQKDSNYWHTLSTVLHICCVYRKPFHGQGIKESFIPEKTYTELMSIFEEIQSVENRTILTGKLLWLKRIYQDISITDTWLISGIF